MKRPSQDLMLSAAAHGMARSGDTVTAAALADYEMILDRAGLDWRDPETCDAVRQAEDRLRARVWRLQ